ncbi:hypothetical protein ACJX0J_026540, partial [Zea mays]
HVAILHLSVGCHSLAHIHLFSTASYLSWAHHTEKQIFQRKHKKQHVAASEACTFDPKDVFAEDFHPDYSKMKKNIIDKYMS